MQNAVYGSSGCVGAAEGGFAGSAGLAKQKDHEDFQYP